MDIYDTMLGSIQQFPLDANYFERRIRRANRTYARYLAAYTRILRHMPPSTHRPLVAARRRLERCIGRKQRIIGRFLECINEQMTRLEEHNRISGSVLALRRLQPSGAAVLRTKENGVLESKICVCNSNDGGMLVCCDSPACQTRWHHCKCVGIVNPPAAGWTCEKCKKFGLL